MASRVTVTLRVSVLKSPLNEKQLFFCLLIPFFILKGRLFNLIFIFISLYLNVLTKPQVYENLQIMWLLCESECLPLHHCIDF